MAKSRNDQSDASINRDLIPLYNSTQSEWRKPKLVIGHNVAFDRQRVLEEYRLEPTGLQFIDTMSLHMAVSGLGSQQRGKWLSAQKKKLELTAADPVITESADDERLVSGKS